MPYKKKNYFKLRIETVSSKTEVYKRQGRERGRERQTEREERERVKTANYVWLVRKDTSEAVPN